MIGYADLRSKLSNLVLHPRSLLQRHFSFAVSAALYTDNRSTYVPIVQRGATSRQKLRSRFAMITSRYALAYSKKSPARLSKVSAQVAATCMVHRY